MAVRIGPFVRECKRQGRARLDQAGPTATGHASISLSRRNMRFRQAVTFPREIEFRLDRVSPDRFQRPPLVVAVSPMATIADLRGAESLSQAATTCARSWPSASGFCEAILEL
jgi:hypothetical protein